MGEQVDDDPRTHYEVIGADPRASKADVKAAYVGALERAQAATDADEVSRVRRAWQVLSDPVQRQRYDEQIGVGLRRGGDHDGRARRVFDGDRDVDRDAGEELEPRDAVPDGDELDVEIDGAEMDDADAALVPGPARRAPLAPGLPSFIEQPTIGRRMTASLIDVVTLLGVFLASITITYQVTGADRGAPSIIIFVGWVEFWILVLLVIPTVRTGQTLGKRFTYVMTVDRATGGLPSIWQVLRRYIVPMVIIPALLQMGAFLALFFGLSYAMGRDQLSLADRLAGTVVAIARYQPTRVRASG